MHLPQFGEALITRRLSDRRGRRRRRRHDQLLVLSISIFNSADGWNRTFNQLKIYENGT